MLHKIVQWIQLFLGIWNRDKGWVEASKCAWRSRVGFQSVGFPCIFHQVSTLWLGFLQTSHQRRPWTNFPRTLVEGWPLERGLGVGTSLGGDSNCWWRARAELSGRFNIFGVRPNTTLRRLSFWRTYEKAVRRLGKGLVLRILPWTSSRLLYKPMRNLKTLMSSIIDLYSCTSLKHCQACVSVKSIFYHCRVRAEKSQWPWNHFDGDHEWPFR